MKSIIKISSLIRKTRLAQKLSIDDIHNKTSLSIRHIENIENGHIVEKLSLHSALGYIKTYCRFLGLDIDHLLEEYKKESVESHLDFETLNHKVSTLPSKRLLKYAALFSCITYGVFYFYYFHNQLNGDKGINYLIEQKMEQ
jgi:cytoskeletal protein RodZ